MFKKFTNGCVKLVQNYLPDPFLFCIILTFIIFISGVLFTGQSPLSMIIHWTNGFWNLLAFAMQMALVLVFGHTLASAPAFKKITKKLARIPKTPTQAILLVTFVSSIACILNWGFGLVIGAIFAKELAKEVDGVDYRLLIASAYSGFLLWHAGLSASIPLTLATGGESLVKATSGAVSAAGVPTTETIFSLCNLVKGNVVVIDKGLLEDEKAFVEMPKENMTPADKLENSKIVTWLISIMGFTYIIYYFITSGFNLNLNIVNFIFLFFGILLHGTPKRFINALMEGAKGAGPILLQFPFYAGIMGMMTGANAEGISLAVLMSNVFVTISNKVTFPMFSFLSAGLVNFFVPSGGGQWAVQAPIMMPAGAELGVSTAKTAMSIAWGDAWTNMIQPFWALPALGIAGLGAKDIMGYCIIDLLYSGVIITVGLTVIGM